MMHIVKVLLIFNHILVATSLPFRRNVANGEDLDALCSGKPIDLVSFTQLKTLLSEVGDSTCSDAIRRALHDLDDLFETDREDVCTMKKVNLIMDFYNAHLDTRDGQEKLPVSLKQFALAYAMQISSHCKLHMMRVLFEKGVNPLSEIDFKELEEWTRQGSAIDNLLTAITKRDEIILPDDLVAAMPDRKLTKQLAVITSASDKITRAKEVCTKRFKPIYGPVVKPVAALTRAGFDLPDVLLKIHKPDHLEVLYAGMRKWSRVVFLCETLELVESSVDKNEVKPGPNTLWPNLEQIELEPEASGGIGNFIMSGYDGKLKKMLKAFSTSKSEYERTKDKLLRRSWRLLKARLRRGEYKAMLRLALDRMGSARSDQSDKALDVLNREITDSLEAKKETAVNRVLSKTSRPFKSSAQSVVSLMTIFSVLQENNLMSFKEIRDLKAEASQRAQ